MYNEKEESIGISCKVNNISIKHQRISSLYNQCNFKEEKKEKFIEEYKKLNNNWYNKIKDKTNYCNINKEEKNVMFIDFNNLVKKYLKQIKNIKCYYDFLISYEKIFVIKYDNKKQQITIINYLNINDAKKISKIEVDNNYINLEFDNKIKIKMRLHTASKSITKSLSLKYDTKIVNTEKIFSEKVFNLQNKKDPNEYKSVLRYPGGKSKAIKILEKYVPLNIDELYSPFIGGGSFELYMIGKNNLKVYTNDKFKPLYIFWNSLKNNKKELVNKVKEIHPITKESFNNYKEKIKDDSLSDLDMGSYYFAINRSSFSGSTTSGGFSKQSGEGRFNLSCINKLDSVNLKKIEFSNKDFVDFIKTIPKDKFIFLDPPYYLGNKSKLYGNSGNLHENFNHNKLKELLSKKDMWLLCYNDCEYIKKEYSSYKIIDAEWSYGMNKSKKSSEIIILSKKLEKLLDNKNSSEYILIEELENIDINIELDKNFKKSKKSKSKNKIKNNN